VQSCFSVPLFILQSPAISRLKGKVSRGLSKDKESTLELKAKISAPVPHIASELLQVRAPPPSPCHPGVFLFMNIRRA
jgi:hypothetical protein